MTTRRVFQRSKRVRWWTVVLAAAAGSLFLAAARHSIAWSTGGAGSPVIWMAEASVGYASSTAAGPTPRLGMWAQPWLFDLDCDVRTGPGGAWVEVSLWPLGCGAAAYAAWSWRWRAVPTGVCERCGYPAEGLAVCPECGRTPRHA
ncbi:MAG TPA: hypothetical protein VEB22_05685 [Phycisphaerales bacterium]|nr:hypothetical protein [Phycisphaerales bacterium]